MAKCEMCGLYKFYELALFESDYAKLMLMLEIIALVLLGLCFGSFVNALTWRLRVQSETPGKKKSNKYSIARGRSMCSKCKHELAWYDLIPIISWLNLRGKCRYCGKTIEDSPLVEVVTALMFVWTYYAWGGSFDLLGTLQFITLLVFVVGFVALAVYDIRWMELPNKIIFFLGATAVVRLILLILDSADAASTLSGAFWGVMLVGGLFYLLFQVSGGKWIGGGDVKLGFVIGLLVGGPVNGFLVIFIASLLGTLAAAPLIFNKSLKVTSRIPFGPFLIIAAYIVYLYGNELAGAYWNFLGVSIT